MILHVLKQHALTKNYRKKSTVFNINSKLLAKPTMAKSMYNNAQIWKNIKIYAKITDKIW